MSNVVQDKNEPNEEIMDVDANVAGTSMDLQRDTGENSTENSNVDLPEVSVALVPANQSNETPEHPPSPMPLEPTPSTSTGQGRRIFDDEGVSGRFLWVWIGFVSSVSMNMPVGKTEEGVDLTDANLPLIPPSAALRDLE